MKGDIGLQIQSVVVTSKQIERVGGEMVGCSFVLEDMARQ